jgi:leucyl aminopeptidase
MRFAILDSARSLPKDALLACFALKDGRPELPSGITLPARAQVGGPWDFRSLRAYDASRGRVLVVGLGKPESVDAEILRRGGALAVKGAQNEGAKQVVVYLGPALEKRVGAEGAGKALAEGALMGSYRFQRFKSKPERPKIAAIYLCGRGSEFKKGARLGQQLAEANCFARDLQNAPGNNMRPRDLAAAAKKIAAGHARIRCKVLDEAQLKRLGMGALLGVAAGTSEPPRLIHLTYKPKGRAKGVVALVGKGLTFDAGGISIKPAARMWDMKYDMSGGAAVLGTFQALRSIDVPLEVHGIVPSSENLPDASAVKPGDVVTAMDGTTIEVLNTDAEGRLILCDALAYTIQKVHPDTIIDLATLTGAVVVALGHELSGLFTRSESLRDDLIAAGESTGENVWPLPLLDFHREQMKGEIADLKNINGADLGGGSIAGAAFLAHFVGDVEWAHLDIAGTAYGSRDRDYVGGSQGSGVGVRLLTQYLADRGRKGAARASRPRAR